MAATLIDQLLHASLLCGMKPGGDPAYRLQLFFVTNKDLRSGSHQSDFQRAIESGVDQKGFWQNHDKWRGEYILTQRGYERAMQRFPSAVPRYSPLRADKFFAQMQGDVQGVHVHINLRHRGSRVFLEGKECRSAKEACERLRARTGVALELRGESAVRVLYNLGVDNDFAMQLGPPC